MQQFQIDGWQNIDNSVLPNRGDRMPSTGEHNKVPTWNNTIKSHVYKSISQLIEIDIDIFIPIIEDYDNYLTNVTKPNTNLARFTMRNGNYFDLELSSTTPIVYPGNTKVLFDDNSSTSGNPGGNSNFLYDKVTNSLKLSNFTFSGRDTVRGQNSYNTFMQYVGTRSLILNGHYRKDTQLLSTDNFTDNIGVGADVLLAALNVNNVTAIGKGAAKELDNAIGGVYLGNYAGSKETDGRRFYIDDESFNSKQIGRESSLLYGEFDNDLLRINGKTYLKEEVRIGDFTRGTASGGMAKMVDTDGTFAPWYHDGTEWRQWDTGANYYLNEITPGTTLAYNATSEVTFHVSGFGDLTLQLGLNAFTDTPPKNAHGEIRRIQLSTGTNANPLLDHNFISYSALEFDTSNNILYVGRGLNLPNTIQTNAPAKVEGTFITAPSLTTGLSHAYAYLRGAWRQLDNEEGNGSSVGDNIGNSFEVYAQQSDSNPTTLEFRTLTAGDGIHLEYTNSTERTAGEITISIDPVLFNYSIDVDAVDDESLITPYKTIPITRGDILDIIHFRKFKSTNNSVIFDVTDDDFIDLSAVNVDNEVVFTNAYNVGGGDIEWYAGKDDPTLHFKTLNGSIFIELSEESNLVTTKLVNAVVDVSNVGDNGVSLIDEYILLESPSLGAGNYSVKLSSLFGLNGILVSNSVGREVTISNEIPISSSVFLGTSYNAETALLNWKVNYATDIRNGVSYTPIEIGGFKIGSNLSYNDATNTLNADDQSASGGDTLTDFIGNIAYIGEIDYNPVNLDLSSRTVTFEFESGYTLDTEIFGFLAFQDIYRDADNDNKGIVVIGDNINVDAGEISVAIASIDNLGLVQVGNGLSITEGGVLSATGIVQDAVLFNWDQYSLHDDDSFNSGEIPLEQGGFDQNDLAARIVRRDRARANIGAPYVNGSLSEDFNANILTAATKVYCDNTSTNEDSTDISRLQNIIFHGAHITTPSSNTGVYISKRASVSDEYTSVAVTNNSVNMLINHDGTGRLNIYKSSNGSAGGSVIKMFSFDMENGDLYVRGNIRCGRTFEAFDTDIDTLLGQ